MLARKTAAALGFCLAMGVGAVQADTIFFDPTGTGSTSISITAFDEIPGNTLAINAIPLAPGVITQTLYQASLGTLLNGSTIVFANGGGGNFFTVVAGFSEQVTGTSVSLDPSNGHLTGTATFDNTAATAALPSFFRICASNTLANDLTGAGFACDAAHAILTGTLSDIIGSVASTDQSTGLGPLTTATCNIVGGVPTAGCFGPGVPLDQFGTNDWPGQNTVTSTGSANILVTVTSFNPLYFPGLLPGATLTTSLTNTSFIDPYNQQDPSRCFTNNGTTSCNVVATGTLGAVNGSQVFGGPNFIFQSDANTQFTVARVPEPGTLALFGLGLGAIAFVLRARKPNA